MGRRYTRTTVARSTKPKRGARNTVVTSKEHCERNPALAGRRTHRTNRRSSRKVHVLVSFVVSAPRQEVNERVLVVEGTNVNVSPVVVHETSTRKVTVTCTVVLVEELFV